EPILAALDARRPRLLAAIQASGAYDLRVDGVFESGPNLVRACISCDCRSAAGAGAGWALAFAASVVRFPEATEMMADVSWFHEPTPAQPGRCTIHEANAKFAEYRGPSSIPGFLAEFNRLETAMLSAIRRGHPPGPLTIRWRQLLGRCRPPQNVY
ncbi:MAG TPA: hypothetical protein VF625_06645, partial [Longimicrobium sp.]